MVVKVSAQPQVVPLSLRQPPGVSPFPSRKTLLFEGSKDTLSQVRSKGQNLQYQALEKVLSSQETGFHLNGENLSPLTVLDLLHGLHSEQTKGILVAGGTFTTAITLGGSLVAGIIAMPILPIVAGFTITAGGIATLCVLSDSHGISFEEHVEPLSAKPLKSSETAPEYQAFQQALDLLIEAKLIEKVSRNSSKVTPTRLGKQVAMAYRNNPELALHASTFLPQTHPALAQKEPTFAHPRSELEQKAASLLDQVASQQKPNLLETLQQEQKTVPLKNAQTS